jgi:hypothetical protein
VNKRCENHTNNWHLMLENKNRGRGRTALK